MEKERPGAASFFVFPMASRQDLLLAREVEDLRRKVLELAAVIGDPMPKSPSPGS
jgi:hypothetical protein